MAKSKNIQKAERESLNIKGKLLEALMASTPEVFAEGRVNWDKVRLALGEHLDASSEKFNFTWAGKAGAVTNVLIPSKATLRPAGKESVKFNTSENLFIEGDNLEVLKLLQKSYFEQVKMIYIDPPYNTGNDFVYKDDFRQPLKNYLEQSEQVDSEGNRLSTNTQASGRFHSDWLTMMYPRLKLAWNLLRHDGVVFVSIDDNEVHHLRMMMDEVFGEENYLNTFCWVNNLKGRQISGAGAAKTYEYILAYAKEVTNIDLFETSVDKLKSLMPSSYKGFDYEIESDTEGDFVVKNELYNTNSAFNEETRHNLVFNIHYNFKKKEVKFSDVGEDITYSGYIKIPPKKNNNGIHRFHAWRWSKEKITKELSGLKFVKTEDGAKIFTKIREYTTTNLKDMITDISTTSGTNEVKDIFDGRKYFDYPKPMELIKLFVIQTKGQDIILDFFAGSATTAHAVLAQNQEDGENRKFIMMQIPEPTDPTSEAYKAGYKTIADIAKERIRRVLKGYGDHKAIDDGFKVFKLGKSNYYDNLFEYDPEKSPEENDKAFKDYLDKAQKELFPIKINEMDIIYENIIKEGLSFNAKIEEVKIGKSTAYKVSDTEREFYISLDEKLCASAIEGLTNKEYKEKIFICFDGALGDSDKANLALNVTLKTI